MLRYPVSTPAQQALLAPLNSLVSLVPACEEWISFLSTVDLMFTLLSTGGLQNLASISSCMANVFDYLYSASAQSVYSSQYLLQLSISARQVSSSASLASQLPAGNVNVVLTPAAQSALVTLQAWDPVQGYRVPDNPAQLANTLIEGVTLQ